MTLKGYCSFYKNLYIGESIRHAEKVKWKLKHGAGQLSIYVITNTSIGNDQLEIMHCANLKQPYYKKNPALVYGIAGSYGEAMDIIIKISDEASDAGMAGNLLTYLLQPSD